MIILWNKQKGTGGSGGGGSAFPTVVTDSGSSLPVDLSGYQLNDTFLNTSDKKIYKAGAGYIKNTSTGYNITIDVDFNTGIGSGFANNKECRTYITGGTWTSSKNYYVKFKYTVEEETPIFQLYSYGKSTYSNFFILDKKIYFAFYKDSSQKSVFQILTTSVNPNIDYILKIERISGNNTCYVKLYNSDNVLIEETSFDGTDMESYNSYDMFYIGYGWYAKEGESVTPHYGTNLFVYLAESSNNFVVYDSNLNWDSGTSLTDKTEVADKTNGALYLYENTELVKIGSSAPTVLTDQTSTSMALAGNTIYKWTSALTSLSFASAEVSDLETVLYFTTGGTISFTDSSNLKWGGDGSAPSLEANTIYCISIRNGLAEIDTFGTVS